MLGETTWSGVRSLVSKYARAGSGDIALVLFSSDSHECAAWTTVALEELSVEVRRVWMAPLNDLTFTERLRAAVPAPGTWPGRLLVFTFERDTMSHTNELNAVLSEHPAASRSVYRVMSAGPEVFDYALGATPEEISARNAVLLERLMPARRLRVRTHGGSDVDIRLDSRRIWISNRGTSRPGGTIVLPAGEVATCPASIDGTFVADFAFNVNMVTQRDVRLDSHPVRLELKGGTIESWSCDDAPTARFLEECFAVEHARRIGELGFGTNPGIGEPVAHNSHVNERRRGIHLGFGQHNQDERVMGYQCPIHLDLIARGGRIWVDDDPAPLDLEQDAIAGAVHPERVRDEDVFAPNSLLAEEQDCCGAVRSRAV